MKRLNRKGFTLVELLAVIVILAIVVGITLVTVLPTLKKSRNEAFKLTAQTAADYLEKQYQLYTIGETDTIDNNIKASFQGLRFTNGKSGTVDFTKDTIELAGLKSSNYISGTWYVLEANGRVCVTLRAATSTNTSESTKTLAGGTSAGEYYDVDNPDATSTACS